MTDKKYVEARNKLIPFAEKYANKVAGKTPSGGVKKEEWAFLWNSTFLKEMDRLAKEKL